ncbi:glutathione S-transferase [Rhodothalassium salexigens DSM 2132]|uniref:Glutathione S-transferase n=1 Tax=Rhodothalassium salexigens DSM 2132 TaxID=1188247 RepID=A0A4R2PE65_RHOSA|nr:glutathione S-transferase family protein [Rhodothalassium salexigens]MBB4211999.1 glutathione S-transferase [Rhodothalassium salexigens DSM 2132]MBK1638515.1 hypothetical protein [Rhodothalassium salexigens DSM 2132]TCP33417.1 glutathione S-transferase [Rhodothalassium salexigens DSM 2132]
MKLYELCGADRAVCFSPFVWRVRLALAHKGLAYEAVPTRFRDKDAYAPSGSRTVPVLHDGDAWVGDSWAIAQYLEDTYPDRPSLFGGAPGRGMARFVARFADRVVVRGLFPMIAVDVAAALDDADAAYFRNSREAALGRTLEQAAEDRAAARDALQARLAPLAATLKDQPFVCGDEPAHGDYLLAGPFAWAHLVSPFDPLAGDAVLCDWRARMFALFDDLIGGARRAV